MHVMKINFRRKEIYEKIVENMMRVRVSRKVGECDYETIEIN